MRRHLTHATVMSKIVFQVFRNGGDDTPHTLVSVVASGFTGPCATNVAAEALSTR